MTEDSQYPIHRPVMPREVLEVLAPVPGERFLDLTVGAAGHALEIAPRLGPDGLLIGVDLDAAVIDIAGNNLTAAGLANFRLHQGNFADCRAMLSREGLSRVNGVLVDLGVSSFELRDASRGFSFVSDGPLDMRMDASAPGVTAAELVNSAPEWELERIFREYGEERLARRIAREIVRTRRDERIERTNQLAQIARRAYGRFGWQRIHPATRIFQALRIAVNDELENLKTLLEIMPDLLEANGRVAVIAFHSLEDRLVKEDFRNRSRSGVYQLLTKRPLRPSPEEVAANPRSRSARLRAAKRSDI